MSSTSNYNESIDLWQDVADRLKRIPKQEREQWQQLLATLEERERMTAQALKLAESGLKMMAGMLKDQEAEKASANRHLQAKRAQASLNHWRVDTQPGSVRCMWMS